MKKALFISASMFLTQNAFADILINIPQVAGKTEKQVSELLGKPTKCGKSKYGTKCSYQIAETEIVFINGKADWITVEALDHLPFSSSTLKFLGLKNIRPSFSNNFTMRWDSIQGLREVSLYKGSTKSDYAYIKAYSK